MSLKNRILVLVGPTGAGKTTVATYLQQQPLVQRVVTHTTRPPRSGEKNCRDYYFETPETFAQQHFLEAVTYGGYQYGSSVNGVMRVWEQVPVAVIVLDSVGASAYQAYFGPEQCQVWFVSVSDPAVLAERLRRRGDAPAAIRARLASSEWQRDCQPPSDCTVTTIINDVWSETVQCVDQLVQKQCT